MIVGQNIKDISEAFEKQTFSGVMLTTNINLDGLFDVADFKCGETCIKYILDKYNPKYASIGLFFRGHTNEVAGNKFTDNLKKLKSFFSYYSNTKFIVKIGYEPEGTNAFKYRAAFNSVSREIRGNNVFTCLNFQGNSDYQTCRSYSPIKSTGDIMTGDHKETLDVDYIAGSVFTINDRCEGAIQLAKHFNIPFIVGEACCRNADTSKSDINYYYDHLAKIIQENDVNKEFGISYISSKWNEYRRWKNSGFWNKTDSRITPDVIENLSSLWERKIEEPKKETNELNIVIGAQGNFEPGWKALDYPAFDATMEACWERLGEVDNILSEHVFEHIQDDIKAFELCYKYMKSGGVLRIAVPDGYNRDSEYYDYVKPYGNGPGANDHKRLYNIDTLTDVLTKAGFKVIPLEYYDSSSVFVDNEWDGGNGKILRSKKFGGNGHLQETSLVVDAVKIC